MSNEKEMVEPSSTDTSSSADLTTSNSTTTTESSSSTSTRSPEEQEEKKKDEESEVKVDEIVQSSSSVTGTNPTCSQNLADQVYHVKWIQYQHKARVSVVTQNENGPCPLLAIMNVLLLRGQVTFPDDCQIVTGQQLMERLGDSILRLTPQHITTEAHMRVDWEQNVSDAVAVLPKLLTGLDVNVRFTGICDFEYTPECIVFDLLAIPLYHGWLADPQQKPLTRAIGNLSYNQVVEKIINDRQSGDTKVAADAAELEMFFDNTASQLTYHGLCELTQHLKDGELAVFFRNNHFSTMLKNEKELFLLVTDQGFLYESRVVWETLSNVDGDSHFVDASLNTVPPKTGPLVSPKDDPATAEKQVDNDYLMAVSLEHEDRVTSQQPPQTKVSPTVPPNENQMALDAQLAWQLQQDENRRAEQEDQQTPDPNRARAGAGSVPQPNASAAAAAVGGSSASGSRRSSEDKSVRFAE